MKEPKQMRFPIPSLQNDLLFRVINGLEVPRVPVWMMRQAGRTDPNYLRLRQQDGRPLEQLFDDVECSVHISLLPKRIGIDAIIMFQDILTPLTPMGMPFRFCPGPLAETPVQTLEQVNALKIPQAKDFAITGQIIQGIQDELSGELPLLGFAGAPLTLAFFMIAGQSPTAQLSDILQFIEENPQIIVPLLDRLTEMTIEYLNYQIDQGVHAIQLFESFANVLPTSLYEQLALPTHQRIFHALPHSTPKIIFAKEFAEVNLLFASGADILSVGKCVHLKEWLPRLPNHIIIQGNIDNVLLRDGGKSSHYTGDPRVCKTNQWAKTYSQSQSWLIGRNSF